MSRRRRWLGLLLGSLATVYLGFLALGGLLLRGCVEDRARDRIASALDAEVTIGSSSFSVWRGQIELEDLVAIRKHGGAVELRIDQVEADLAGWGLLLVDRDVDRALVRGVRMNLSARGLAAVVRREGDRKPLEVGELVLEDVSLAVMPTALLPGLGRIETTIARAVARPANLAGGLSWLDGLAELDSTFKAPGGVGVTTRYRAGSLALSGSWFGSTPVTIPFEIPDLDPDAYEIDQLKVLVGEIVRAAGRRMVREAAKDAVLDRLRSLAD